MQSDSSPPRRRIFPFMKNLIGIIWRKSLGRDAVLAEWDLDELQVLNDEAKLQIRLRNWRECGVDIMASGRMDLSPHEARRRFNEFRQSLRADVAPWNREDEEQATHGNGCTCKLPDQTRKSLKTAAETNGRYSSIMAPPNPCPMFGSRWMGKTGFTSHPSFIPARRTRCWCQVRHDD